jgi:hypothetical protein
VTAEHNAATCIDCRIIVEDAGMSLEERLEARDDMIAVLDTATPEQVAEINAALERGYAAGLPRP